MVACHVRGETPPPTPLDNMEDVEFTEEAQMPTEEVESDLDEDGEDEVKNELKSFARGMFAEFEENMKKNDEELEERVLSSAGKI